MKKILLFFIISIFCINLSANSHQTKYNLAINMLNVMNKNRFIEKYIDNLILSEVHSNPLLSMKGVQVTKFFRKYAGFNAIKRDLAQIYTKELTTYEIKQFTNFFSTKLGQKMILKMPRLIGLSSNMAQRKIESRYPQLIKTILK